MEDILSGVVGRNVQLLVGVELVGVTERVPSHHQAGTEKRARNKTLDLTRSQKNATLRNAVKWHSTTIWSISLHIFLFWIRMRNSAMPWTNLWWERQYLCQSILVYLEFFPRCIDGLFNWNIHYQKLLKRQERTKNYSVLNTALSRIDFRLELQEGRA